LKKIKFRRENEESKINAYKSFILNINELNPTFRNTFGREDSTLNNNNHNEYHINENEMNNILTEVEEELSDKNCFRICREKTEEYIKSNNFQTVSRIGGTLSKDKTKRIRNNLVKSISKNSSSLKNNVTFCNYDGFVNSKYCNSFGMENSLLSAKNKNSNCSFVCKYCNNINIPHPFYNININNNYNNNQNSSQSTPPFKLINNTYADTQTENYNSETHNFKLKTPKKKNSSPNIYSKREIILKEDLLTKNSSSKDQFFNDYYILKNAEKSPDKDLIVNLKQSPIVNSSKVNLCDLDQINSISNTPKGINVFNLTSPNNVCTNVNLNLNYMNTNNIFYINNNSNNNNQYLLTSEREKSCIQGGYENFRHSLLSNSSNRKINDDGVCISELKILRKENLLYKNCFEAMTNEISNFKFNEKNKEEALDKFYDENRVIYEKEVTCFWKALKIYQEIFVDQIKIKENKIKEMSKVFDEMVVGENSILMGNNMYGGKQKNFLRLFYNLLKTNSK